MQRVLDAHIVPIPEVAMIEPGKKVFSLLDEFKAFALKGNMIDLAVAVVIGGAFGKVIDALVKNLMMPLISVVLPGPQGYAGWSFTIEGVTVPYGLFIGELVNFIIVALAVFIFIVKFLGFIVRKKQESPPPPTKDQELLMEIRDLLKKGLPAVPEPLGGPGPIDPHGITASIPPEPKRP